MPNLVPFFAAGSIPYIVPLLRILPPAWQAELAAHVTAKPPRRAVVELETKKQVRLRQATNSVTAKPPKTKNEVRHHERRHSKSVAASRAQLAARRRLDGANRSTSPRQVITHTRRSSRCARSQTTSSFRERIRWSIAPTDEFVGVFASGKLEKGGSDSNTETFRRGPAG